MDELKLFYHYHIQSFADEFAKPVIYIDDLNRLMYNKDDIFVYSKKKYEDYIKNYITTAPLGDMKIWEIVLKELEERVIKK